MIQPIKKGIMKDHNINKYIIHRCENGHVTYRDKAIIQTDHTCQMCLSNNLKTK